MSERRQYSYAICLADLTHTPTLKAGTNDVGAVEANLVRKKSGRQQFDAEGNDRRCVSGGGGTNRSVS